MDVPGSIIIDETRFALALVEQGVGLSYAPELAAREFIERGSMRIVLEQCASFGQGYYMYHSSRRQLPTGLRLLMETIREVRPLGF